MERKLMYSYLKPFIGPKSFEESDSSFFFGREREVQEILTLVLSSQISLIYAKSGVGKTSIFQAKVLSELRGKKFKSQVLPIARVKSIDTLNNSNTNNKISNIYIYNTIKGIQEKLYLNNNDDDKENLLNDFTNTKLYDFLKVTPIINEKILDKYYHNIKILIFDQFEEFFTSFIDNRFQQQKDFFQQIKEAINQDPNLRIVFIMREEYIAFLDNFSYLFPDGFRRKFRLEPLRKGAAMTAIQRPLLYAMDLEPKLKEIIDENIIKIISKKVVDNLLKIHLDGYHGDIELFTDEFVEPVQLQVVCLKLWEQKIITGKIKKEIENIDLGDIDNALTSFYDDIIKEAKENSKRKENYLRAWCEQNLITSSGTRNIIFKGKDFTEGLENSVLDIFEKKYLIRGEWRSSARWYELAHDRLIKPIKNSNQKWQKEYERKKKSTIIKISLPAIVFSLVLGYFILSFFSSSYHINPVESVFAGQWPYIVSVDEDTGRIYVTNPSTNSVSVINGKTNEFIENITVGNRPTDIAVDSKNNLVYVANQLDNTTSVISTETNDIIYTIKQLKYPNSVAFDSKLSKLYISNSGDNTVSVIDGKTNEFIENIKVGNRPTDIAVDSKNNLVYVINSQDNTVSVIDGTTYKSSEPPLRVGEKPTSLAIDDNSSLVYVTNSGDNTVSVINGKTNTAIEPLKMRHNLASILIDSKNHIFYIANPLDNTVSVINGTTYMVIATLNVGHKPASIAINNNPMNHILYVANTDDNTITAIDISKNIPKDAISKIRVENYPSGITMHKSMVYVANTGSNSISVIDGNTNILTKIIQVGEKPTALAIDDNSSLVYVTNSGDNTVSVIDGKTNEFIENIKVGNRPTDIAVDSKNNLVYVINSQDNTVSVIDGKTHTLIKNITIKDLNRPTDIAVDSKNNLVYVANTNNNTVSVIDGKTNEFIENIKVGNRPTDIAVDSKNNLVYVANTNNNTISVIDGKTHTLIKNITIKDLNRPTDIAVDSKRNYLYVVNSLNGYLSYIEVKFFTDKKDPNYIRVKSLQVDNNASNIAFDSGSNTIYVTDKDDNITRILKGIEGSFDNKLFCPLLHIDIPYIDIPNIDVHTLCSML
jgi:YVTN family beta-propeller protein